MTDPIADMLTRIRNAQLVHKIEVEIPHSKFKEVIANKLKDEGYVSDVSVVDLEVSNKVKAFKKLVIKLKYYQSKPVIEKIKRISKPSVRSFTSKNEVPRVKNGLGIALISTSKGVLTDKQARKLGVGGEIICEVY